MRPPPDAAVFVRRLLRWGRANRRSFPWRTAGVDPFRVLVAEVLLQRSRASSVARVYPRFFERWPTASALAGAQERSIAAVIRPLGLVGRARTLRLMARAVVAAGGAVPRTVAGMLELPGVGPYAAAATAVVAYATHVGVVDGVSARVYRRYFGLTWDQPPGADRELQRLVDQVTPRRAVREWNWAVLDLAAAVCAPKVPRCDVCPLVATCAGARLDVARLDVARPSQSGRANTPAR